jgi:non-ribosomal peptide synthetase component F
VWWLSGGCALDLFVGRRTRAHGDIDISVRRDQLPGVAAQLEARLELQIARDGQLWPLDADSADASVHGLWARAVGGGPWRLQVNLEPCSGEEWIYRRDPRVHRPLAELIEHRGGVPCVKPAVQLLWKARDHAPKDEIDLSNVLPLLPAAERAWLASAIALAHPESPWRERIEGGASSS